MANYKPFFEDEVYEKYFESASTKRPEQETGYTIQKKKIRDPSNPKKLIMGYTKVKKKGVKAKHSSLSKAQRQNIAKKNWKKRKANPTQLKKSMKKSVQTRKANK